MSNAYLLPTTGNLPPSVPTSFSLDINDTAIVPGDIPASAGSAVPVANVLRVSGDNGIKTIATPNAPGNATIRFIRGETTTVGFASSVCLTQPVVNNTTLTIQIIIAGYGDNNDAIGAYGTAVVKNVGGTASLIEEVDLIVNADTSLIACDFNVLTSGANLEVNVTGVPGVTIAWTTALPGIVST